MEKLFLPLVTIVTPSFNQGLFIEETILSVFNQTYQNIQYIVVDGGSADNTMDVVNKYRDRIDIIIHEKDKGQTDAINKGFKLAKGELMGWINSDDVLYPDCVAKIVELYKGKSDGAIYYNSYNDRINRESKLLSTYKKAIPNKNYLLNVNYDVVQQASFYKAEFVKKINYLDESLHYCMDLDLWLRLLDYGPIYACNEKSLSAFRIWEETKTSNGGYKFLREIRKTIVKYGASPISPTIRRTYWYQMKDHIKRLIAYK